MNDQQCVVVGCDGTPDGDPALRFAAQQARLHQVRLVVITAYDRPLDPDLDDFDTPDTQLRAQACARAEDAVRRAFNAHSEPVPDHELIPVEGDPARALLAHASGAVMIVVGSHDRSFLERFFARHTGPHLLQGSDVPVTIVPPAVRT